MWGEDEACLANCMYENKERFVIIALNASTLGGAFLNQQHYIIQYILLDAPNQSLAITIILIQSVIFPSIPLFY